MIPGKSVTSSLLAPLILLYLRADSFAGRYFHDFRDFDLLQIFCQVGNYIWKIRKLFSRKVNYFGSFWLFVGFEVHWNSIGVNKGSSKIGGIPWGTLPIPFRLKCEKFVIPEGNDPKIVKGWVTKGWTSSTGDVRFFSGKTQLLPVLRVFITKNVHFGEFA